MKKGMLLNYEISSVIAKMGHTDMLVLSDCGLPIHNAKRIDIALKRGIPGFLDTLDAVLSELSVEKVILSEELRDQSPEMHEKIIRRFSDGIIVEYVAHEEFKKLSQVAAAVIRTGEDTAFANIILVSGVEF